jgi:hypothetical protein
MTDIRLNQPKTSRIWGTVGVFAFVALLLWASAFLFGDATAPESGRGVGAMAGFGDRRAPVLPARATPFTEVIPPATRDLGRLVHITGRAESRVAANSVWVRTPENFRILVRFEPAPAPELLAGIGSGSPVAFNGYVTGIAVAEFRQILDSLGVRLPRPPPARKFGDQPDPGFAAVDSLFIKAYYISVRPEGIRPEPPPPTQPRANG